MPLSEPSASTRSFAGAAAGLTEGNARSDNPLLRLLQVLDAEFSGEVGAWDAHDG